MDRLKLKMQLVRDEADGLLYTIARSTGTGRTRAWCIWAAVRAGGAGAYVTGPARQQRRLEVYRSTQRL